MKGQQIVSSPRRLSRRAAVSGGGAGLAALALGGPRGAMGQAATPVSSGVSLLFVQSFTTSALDPIAGDPAAFTLTLQQDSGQTLYFADRPNRMVGIFDSATWVEGFAKETATDPANAALVAQTGDAGVAIHVVELTALRYDAATNVATYKARLLDDPAKLGLRFDDQPQQTIDGPRRYGSSQLFIDAGGLMQLVAYGAQNVYLDGSGG